MDTPARIPAQTDVETLAQALYEASEGSQSTSWAERGRTVRDAWLNEARRQLGDRARQPGGAPQ
jgi:hypothetical protein